MKFDKIGILLITKSINPNEKEINVSGIKMIFEKMEIKLNLPNIYITAGKVPSETAIGRTKGIRIYLCNNLYFSNILNISSNLFEINNMEKTAKKDKIKPLLKRKFGL